MVAVVWVGVIAPLLDWYGGRTLLLEQRLALARRMAVVAEQVPSLRQLLSAAGPGAGTPAPDAMLAGATDAIAAAGLQARLGELAARSGATLASVETQPAAQVGAYRRIPLRLSVTAPWPGLVQLLSEIAQAAPRMTVDDLQIRGAALGGAMPAPGVPAQLQATLTVAGFRPAGAGG
jgi:general secretion pathway protein M